MNGPRSVPCKQIRGSCDRRVEKSLDIVLGCKYNKRGMVCALRDCLARGGAFHLSRTGIWPGIAFIAAWRFIVISTALAVTFATISHGDKRTPLAANFRKEVCCKNYGLGYYRCCNHPGHRGRLWRRCAVPQACRRACHRLRGGGGHPACQRGDPHRRKPEEGNAAGGQG